MPKLIVSIDGVVIKEVQLTKDRTTLGRRPYNDIVIDNLAVSGEHAVLLMVGNDVFMEDLNSTNGTYLNGKAVKKQLLQNGDIAEIGKYRIKFIHEQPGASFEKTMVMKAGSVAAPVAEAAGAAASASSAASAGLDVSGAVKVLNGAAAGREVQLTKIVTTIGKPGVQVASITKRGNGYVLAHVEGATRPSVNGAMMGEQPVALRQGDVIELAGTQMQFVQH